MYLSIQKTRFSIETYLLPYNIDNQWEFAIRCREPKAGALWQPDGCNAEGCGREVQEGGDISIPMADLSWYIAETITILQCNYPLIEN